ncbi:MAG: ATP-binding protein [Magnetococcus sp. YQC-3]
MAGLFCVFCCETFRPELAAAARMEDLEEVRVIAFPVRCGRPPVSWQELEALLPEQCSGVAIVGRACLKGLETPPSHWPTTHILPQQDCFHLLADVTLVSEAIARGAYLITPGWLENWPQRLEIMGFSLDNAGEFFSDFARELLLLDTGTRADTQTRLQELAATVHLPVQRMSVGLGHARLFLLRLVAQWRLTEERKLFHRKTRMHAQEMADMNSSLDFLGRLALLREEKEAMAVMDEMFRMLFAPKVLYVSHKVAGVLQEKKEIPQPLHAEMAALTEEWSWTRSGEGFILRLGAANGLEHVLLIDGLSFPQFRERYLGLALNLAGICGLVLQNSHTLQRIREAEAALLDLNQELREFAYVASHDLQEPLRTITNYAAFLREDLGDALLDGAVLEDLRFITEAVGRMQTLIHDLLAYSRSGQLEVKNHPVALQEALHTAMDNLRASLEESHARITWTDLPKVRGDFSALVRVLQNLLGNALKFRKPDSDPEIRLEAAQEGNHWLIRVTDNGIGMAENHLQQIFQPFKRLHSNKEYPGSGLGLSIVKKTVERHGGSVQVSSIPGQGSTFTLCLPAWIAQAPDLPAADASPVGEPLGQQHGGSQP